jgi:hypothetical protein
MEDEKVKSVKRLGVENEDCTLLKTLDRSGLCVFSLFFMQTAEGLGPETV